MKILLWFYVWIVRPITSSIFYNVFRLYFVKNDAWHEWKKLPEKEQRKTAAIVANFIDPIIVIDNENKIYLINSAAKEIFQFIDDDFGRVVSCDNNFSMLNFRDIIKKDFQVRSHKQLKSENPNEEEVLVKHNGEELSYKVITARVMDGVI